jgi:predicted phage tail protein
MKQNEGTTDRILRLIIGAVFLLVAFVVLDAAAVSAGGIVLAVIGAVLMLTGAVGYCMLYTVFHFSTKK